MAPLDFEEFGVVSGISIPKLAMKERNFFSLKAGPLSHTRYRVAMLVIIKNVLTCASTDAEVLSLSG